MVTRSPDKQVAVFVLVFVLAGLVVALVSYFGGSQPKAQHVARAHVQKEAIVILAGDREEGGNIAVEPAAPIRITVANFTHELHTFTIPGTRVNKLVYPAGQHRPSSITFTFRAGKSKVLVWYCEICPSGAHGRAHTMGGTIYPIISPSALS